MDKKRVAEEVKKAQEQAGKVNNRKRQEHQKEIAKKQAEEEKERVIVCPFNHSCRMLLCVDLLIRVFSVEREGDSGRRLDVLRWSMARTSGQAVGLSVCALRSDQGYGNFWLCVGFC